MSNERLFAACIEVVEELRQAVFIPWDTGNMATKSLRYQIEGNVFHVYMDEGIAPYVVFTNEPWISPRWHGKSNPNEGWWNDFADIFARRLTLKLQGELENGFFTANSTNERARSNGAA